MAEETIKEKITRIQREQKELSAIEYVNDISNILIRNLADVAVRLRTLELIAVELVQMVGLKDAEFPKEMQTVIDGMKCRNNDELTTDWYNAKEFYKMRKKNKDRWEED